MLTILWIYIKIYCLVRIYRVYRGTLVFRFKTIRVFDYVSSFYIKNRYILIYERYGIQLATGRCAVQERIRKDVEEAAMVERGISLRKGQPPARRSISGGKVPGSWRSLRNSKNSLKRRGRIKRTRRRTRRKRTRSKKSTIEKQRKPRDPEKEQMIREKVWKMGDNIWIKDMNSARINCILVERLS